MKVDRKTLIVGGAAGAAVLLFLFRKQVAQVGNVVIDAAKVGLFKSVISDEANVYADVILRVAGEQGVDPFLVVALGERETRWGTGAGYSPQGPAGTGDGGHGRGLLQIDDRTWGDWLAANDWTNPYMNITKGVQILKSNLSYFASKGVTGQDQLLCAIAAYNHGPGNVWRNYQAGGTAAIDNGTAGGDYSEWVATTLASLTNSFLAQTQQTAVASNMLPDTAEGADGSAS